MSAACESSTALGNGTVENVKDVFAIFLALGFATAKIKGWLELLGWFLGLIVIPMMTMIFLYWGIKQRRLDCKLKRRELNGKK